MQLNFSKQVYFFYILKCHIYSFLLSLIIVFTFKEDKYSFITFLIFHIIFMTLFDIYFLLKLIFKNKILTFTITIISFFIIIIPFVGIIFACIMIINYLIKNCFILLIYLLKSNILNVNNFNQKIINNKQINQNNTNISIFKHLSNRNKMKKLENDLKEKQLQLNNLINKYNDTKLNLNNLKEEYNLTVFNLETIKKEVENCKDNILKIKNIEMIDDAIIFDKIYNLSTSNHYNIELNKLLNEQKAMQKNDEIFIEDYNIKNKLESKNIKNLCLLVLINQCKFFNNKLTLMNIEKIKKNIQDLFKNVNNCLLDFNLKINSNFLNLKLKELELYYEYELKKNEEKLHQKEIREEEKEYEKIEKEIRQILNKNIKEKEHYEKSIQAIENKLKLKLSEDSIKILQEEKERQLEKIEILNNSINEENNLIINQKAGYVYILSNIGSFGENIVKIGMTRRINPIDRVNELSSASVPFKFDVHCFIFSEDAPALENKLHKKFEKYKINKINNRKEFFEIDLNIIEKEILTNIDNTIEFIKYPKAEEYRASLKIIKKEV